MPIIISITKEKQYRWKPLVCNATHILFIIKKNTASGLEMIINYKGQRYSIGVSYYSDSLYNRHFDLVFHINDQEFNTFNEFLEKAYLGDAYLHSIEDTFEILEINEGNPYHYVLLTEIAAGKDTAQLWQEIYSNIPIIKVKNYKPNNIAKENNISRSVNSVLYWDYYKYLRSNKKHHPHTRKPTDKQGNVVFEENASSNFFIREMVIRTLNVVLAFLFFSIFNEHVNPQTLGGNAFLNLFAIYYLIAYFGFRFIVPAVYLLFIKRVRFQKNASADAHCEMCHDTKPDIKTFFLYVINGYLDTPFIYCPSCDRVYRYCPSRGSRALALIPFIPIVCSIVGAFIFFKVYEGLITILLFFLLIQLLPMAFLISAKKAWQLGCFKKSKEVEIDL